MLRRKEQGSKSWGDDPSQILSQSRSVCGLGQETPPVRASVSSSVKWPGGTEWSSSVSLLGHSLNV